MNFLKVVLLTVLLAGYAFTSNAKGYKAAKVYMFGFAASFNDSTVYFTDVQQVAVNLIDDRTRFLANRNEYSNQLRQYLKSSGKQEHPTAVVLYAEDRRQIDKKLTELKEKYTTKAKSKFFVETLSAGQFTFSPVEAAQDVEMQRTTYRSTPAKPKE